MNDSRRLIYVLMMLALLGLVAVWPLMNQKPALVSPLSSIEVHAATAEPKTTEQEDAAPLSVDVKATDSASIKKLIAQTFPEDPRIAIAVAKSESGLKPTKTLIAKAGHYSWSTPTYRGECSVGLFMINLAEDGCEGRGIHWKKIPGETIEEKIEWLKIPENNISIARDIYDSRGGSFKAWSGYSGGGYKRHLEEL